MAFRCVPYSWRICIQLTYRNIAFSCCIKKTLKAREARGFLVCAEHPWGARCSHRCVGPRGMERGTRGPLSTLPRLPESSCPCSASMPLMCLLPAPLPQVDTVSRARAFPTLGPRLGEIVSTLGHTLAQRWGSRVTIYRSESSSEPGASSLAASACSWPAL